MEPTSRNRTIWISDFHLGTRGCKALPLLDFLRRNESETLFLVGDIFDGWTLARAWRWEQPHHDVARKLLRKARKGTCVIYLPGNHDVVARDYVGLRFGHVRVESEVVHTLANERRLLVLHGDQFNGMLRHAPWHSRLGARAYRLLLVTNRWVNAVRRLFGMPWWSLSAWLKLRTKRAVQFLADYETAMVRVARARETDGIVCGRVHHAEIRAYGDCLYTNCSDWFENCTAIAERFDGSLAPLRWTEAGRKEPVRQISIGDGRPGAAPTVARKHMHALEVG